MTTARSSITLRWTSGGYPRTAIQTLAPADARCVVVALHGHGGSGRAFAQTIGPAVPAGVALVCPDGRQVQEPAGLRRGWAYPGVDLFGRGQDPAEDMDAIGGLLLGPLAGYDRVILVGYSQGAALTGALSYMRHTMAPELLVVGYGMIAGGPTPTAEETLGRLLERPGLAPVYLRVGDKDDRVPLAAAERMIATLRQDRADVDAVIMPGVTHRQAPQRALPSLRAWLARVCA